MTLDLPQIVQRFSLDLGGLKRGEAEVGGIFGRIAGASSRAGSALTKGISLPLAALGGFAIESAIKVEEAQFKIRRGTGETGTVLAQLNKDFAAVGRQTARSFSDVADIISNVHQRLGLVGGPLQALTLTILRLQKVTGDTAPTVDDITRLFAQWGVQTRNQTSTLDLLYRATERSGIPMNQLVGILDQFGPHLRAVGFSVASAAALLASLSKAGIDAGQVMGGLRKFFTAAAKAGKDPAVAFADVIKQMRLLVEEGKKTEAQNLGIKMFGTRGVGLIRAIIEGKLQYQAFLDTISKGRDTIAASAASTVSLGDQFKILKNKAELSLAPIGERFFPLIAKVINAAIPILNVFASVLDRLGPAVVPIGAALITLGPGLLIFGKLSRAATDSIAAVRAAGDAFKRLFGVQTEGQKIAEATAAAKRAEAAATTEAAVSGEADAAAQTQDAAATAAEGVAAGEAAVATQGLAVAEGEAAVAGEAMGASGLAGAGIFARLGSVLGGIAVGPLAILATGLAAVGFEIYAFNRHVDATSKGLKAFHEGSARLATANNELRTSTDSLGIAERNEALLRGRGLTNTDRYRRAVDDLAKAQIRQGEVSRRVTAAEQQRLSGIGQIFEHIFKPGILDKFSKSRAPDELRQLAVAVGDLRKAGVGLPEILAQLDNLKIRPDQKRQLEEFARGFYDLAGDLEKVRASASKGLGIDIQIAKSEKPFTDQLHLVDRLVQQYDQIGPRAAASSNEVAAALKSLIGLTVSHALGLAREQTALGHYTDANKEVVAELDALKHRYPELAAQVDAYERVLKHVGPTNHALATGLDEFSKKVPKVADALKPLLAQFEKMPPDQTASSTSTQALLDKLVALRQEYPQLAGVVQTYIDSLRTQGAVASSLSSGELKRLDDRLTSLKLSSNITATVSAIIRDDPRFPIKELDAILRRLRVSGPIRAKIEAAVTAAVKAHLTSVTGTANFSVTTTGGNRGSMHFYRQGGLLDQAPNAAGVVPILAHPKEFIVRPEAVRAAGTPFLYALNQTATSRDVAALFAMVPRFDTGGLISTPQFSGYTPPSTWTAKPSGASSTTYDQRSTHLTILNPKPQAAEDSIQRQLRALVYLGWLGPESR